MTEYVETPWQWQAIMWDGTNSADVATAAGSTYETQGVYVSPGNDQIVIIPSSSARDITYMGIGMWFVYHPSSSVGVPYDGDYRIVADDSGSPAGFTEV